MWTDIVGREGTGYPEELGHEFKLMRDFLPTTPERGM